jgi:hypothetical protein
LQKNEEWILALWGAQFALAGSTAQLVERLHPVFPQQRHPPPVLHTANYVLLFYFFLLVSCPDILWNEMPVVGYYGKRVVLCLSSSSSHPHPHHHRTWTLPSAFAHTS